NRPIIPPADLANRFHAEILMTNAYILGRGPHRESVLRQGLHEFLGYSGAIMSDSGAFQSHVYGDVDVTNAEVIEFQKRIGTDFGTMLDVFSEPSHDRTQAAADVEETIRRAKEADSLRGEMALVGAVQGGLHPDLRERCAREVSTLGVSVCAIGGVVPLLESYRFQDLARVVIASKKGLDPAKPVHLFGAGHPLVFPLAALLGCDLFDSASYAKYARDGRMLFHDGTRRASELRESGCPCPVCTDHAMKEIAQDEALIAEHNLHTCFAAVREVRRTIAHGDLWELVERRARAHPTLLVALRELRHHNEFLEEFEPVARRGALYYVGPETAHRPVLYRFRRRLMERYQPPSAKGLVVLPENRRPFTGAYASAVARVMETSDVHAVVKSIWGPVPLDRGPSIRSRRGGRASPRDSLLRGVEEHREGPQRHGRRGPRPFPAGGGRPIHAEGGRRRTPPSRVPSSPTSHHRRRGCRPVRSGRKECLREVRSGGGSGGSASGRDARGLSRRRAVRGRPIVDEPAGDALVQARRRRVRPGGRAAFDVRSATLMHARYSSSVWRRLIGPSAAASAIRVRPRRVVRM